VAVLVEGERDGGRHEAAWDAGASGVASGVYVYRLRAGDYVGTQKLIVVR
jgi:hypothetical protein